MKIKLTDKFFIDQCIHAPFCWDLIKVSYGNRNDQKNVRVETPVAFGMTLQHLIKVVADYEIYETLEEFETFEKYIEEYKKVSESILSKLKENLKK